MKLVELRTFAVVLAAAALAAPPDPAVAQSAASAGARAEAPLPYGMGFEAPYPVASEWSPSVRGDTISPSLDVGIATRIRASGIHEHPSARVVAGTFRLASVPGTFLLAASLFAAGELGDREDLRDLGLRSGQAIALAGTGTLAGKLLVGRARPRISPYDAWDVELARGVRGDPYQSFPSAHTAAAFAAATVIGYELAEGQPERARWVYPALYTSATMAGLSRLFDEAHWATDVIGGALLGILGGVAVVQYHHD